MATSNAQRFLASGGDDTSLGLTMFWGTVLEAFRAKTVLWNAVGPGGVGAESMTGAVASKMVESGKSWEFPIIGDDPTPEYHTPGVELLGQDVSLTSDTITIDQILVSHYDVAADHTQISHFDVLRPFAIKLGRSLATQFDKNLIQLGVLAAETAASTGFHNGGNVVQQGNHATVAAAYPLTAAGFTSISGDLADLARLMDEDDVPEDGRFLVITPYIRQVLTFGADTVFYDKTLSDSTPNSLVDRRIGRIHGFEIIGVTNHLPTTDISTGPTKYQVDGTIGAGTGTPVALALCGAQEGSAAVGYVAASDPQLGPIYAFRFYDERRNTTFMKAQMMVGADVLAPWCAGVVNVDNV